MKTLNAIESQLKSEEIEYSLEINNPEITIESLSYIYNCSEYSLAYYTGEDLSQFTLKDCTIVCSQKTNRDNKQLNYIVVEDAKIAFYVVAQLFAEEKYKAGIHPSAQVDSNAVIHPKAYIGPNCVVESGVSIGEGSIIHSNTHIYSKSEIGKNVVIEANSSIGASGLFWTWDQKGQMWQLPFRGGVIIEDDVFLGTDISVVRGCFDEDRTIIGSRSKLAHGTKVGHDCKIGDANHIANNVSLGGKVILKDRCFLGSGCIVKAGAKLADDIIVGAGAVVTKDYEEERLILVGNPAKPMKTKNDRPSGMHAPLYMVKKD